MTPPHDHASPDSSGSAGHGAVQHRRGPEPALAGDGRGCRPQLDHALGPRGALLLRAAGTRRQRPLGPLSRGGRHLLLDQADLRRRPRFHLRLVLLGQQHPVLPEPADVHRGDRDLRRRKGRARGSRTTGTTSCRRRSSRSGSQPRSTSSDSRPGVGSRISARSAPISRVCCSSAWASTPWPPARRQRRCSRRRP